MGALVPTVRRMLSQWAASTMMGKGMRTAAAAARRGRWAVVRAAAHSTRAVGERRSAVTARSSVRTAAPAAAIRHRQPGRAGTGRLQAGSGSWWRVAASGGKTRAGIALGGERVAAAAGTESEFLPPVLQVTPRLPRCVYLHPPRCASVCLPTFLSTSSLPSYPPLPYLPFHLPYLPFHLDIHPFLSTPRLPTFFSIPLALTLTRSRSLTRPSLSRTIALWVPATYRPPSAPVHSSSRVLTRKAFSRLAFHARDAARAGGLLLSHPRWLKLSLALSLSPSLQSADR